MREVVLGVIDLALISGLLWSLWFVVHASRQRQRRNAEQLAAPIVRTSDRMLIGRNRKETAASTVFFAWLTLAALRWVVNRHVSVGVLALFLFGAGVFVFARETLQRGPVLVIDGEAMTVTSGIKSSSRRILWDSVERIWLDERRGVNGVTRYDLICELGPREPGEPGSPYLDAPAVATETVRVPLQMLSMPWSDVVRAIQDRLGRRVLVIKQ